MSPEPDLTCPTCRSIMEVLVPEVRYHSVQLYSHLPRVRDARLEQQGWERPDACAPKSRASRTGGVDPKQEVRLHRGGT